MSRTPDCPQKEKQLVLGARCVFPLITGECVPALRDLTTDRVHEILEEEDTERESHCEPGSSSRDFWTDAYLAAFAEAGDFALATFDKGFQRFPHLKLALLS